MCLINSVFKIHQQSKCENYIQQRSLLHDSSKVLASANVKMGRRGDVMTTSAMGYDHTDDFGMVCFVPPTSSVCRVGL